LQKGSDMTEQEIAGECHARRGKRVMIRGYVPATVSTGRVTRHGVHVRFDGTISGGCYMPADKVARSRVYREGPPVGVKLPAAGVCDFETRSAAPLRDMRQRVAEQAGLAITYAEDGAYFTCARVLRELWKEVSEHADRVRIAEQGNVDHG
jgi:hypothetical protein